MTMPVTARLSRKLYDVLSEDVVTELVEWFNLVDATYRGDLRELNELNFARFDAKLEQRIAQVEAKVDQRITQVEARLDQRITQVEAKLEQRIAQVEAKMDQRFTHLEERMTREFAVQRAEMLKWMFLFWATTALGVIGLFKF